MSDIIHEVETTNSTPVAEQYTPSVYLEVSKEQVELLEVGKDVIIELAGKVKGLESREGDQDNNRYEIRLELKEVRIDPQENEFGELAEDD